MERSTRGTGVLRLLKCLRLEPGGSGPEAVRTPVILSGGLTTPGSVCESWPGGHEEGLRRTRGDAAGTQSGSSFIERTTVNTGTVPNLAPPFVSHRLPGLGDPVGWLSGRGGFPPVALVFTKDVGAQARMNRIKPIRDLCAGLVAEVSSRPQVGDRCRHSDRGGWLRSCVIARRTDNDRPVPSSHE